MPTPEALRRPRRRRRVALSARQPQPGTGDTRTMSTPPPGPRRSGPCARCAARAHDSAAVAGREYSGARPAYRPGGRTSGSNTTWAVRRTLTGPTAKLAATPERCCRAPSAAKPCAGPLQDRRRLVRAAAPYGRPHTPPRPRLPRRGITNHAHRHHTEALRQRGRAPDALRRKARARADQGARRMDKRRRRDRQAARPRHDPGRRPGRRPRRLGVRRRRASPTRDLDTGVRRPASTSPDPSS